MKNRIKTVYYILLLLLFMVAAIATIRWTKSPSELRRSDARGDALKMSGINFEVVPGEEGKITTELAIFDPATKNWYPLIPCTEEQRQLKVGDRVVFHYKEKKLGNAVEPMAEKFCHMEIYSK